MTKMIVETKGAYQLAGSMMDGSDRVPFDRPAVVAKSTYIELKIQSEVSGLAVHADDLPDTASDEDFAATLAECDGDVEAAVEIYLSELKGIEDQKPKKENASDRKARLAAEKKADEDKKAAADAANRGKEGFTASDAVPPAKPGTLAENPSTDIELQKG
jgi:hypothetical protein